MEAKIKWEEDLKTALSLAREGNKPILLFFHNPN
jgi:hypothetical protein